jgi:hypothetical protein
LDGWNDGCGNDLESVLSFWIGGVGFFLFLIFSRFFMLYICGVFAISRLFKWMVVRF